MKWTRRRTKSKGERMKGTRRRTRSKGEEEKDEVDEKKDEE